jgi:hypothetical protein
VVVEELVVAVAVAVLEDLENQEIQTMHPLGLQVL